MSEAKERILTCAAEIARDSGFPAVTQQAVAKRAQVSSTLVPYHFETMGRLKDEVIKIAIDNRDAEVVAQAIAVRHPLAKRLPGKLKKEATAILTEF